MVWRCFLSKAIRIFVLFLVFLFSFPAESTFCCLPNVISIFHVKSIHQISEDTRAMHSTLKGWEKLCVCTGAGAHPCLCGLKGGDLQDDRMIQGALGFLLSFPSTPSSTLQKCHLSLYVSSLWDHSFSSERIYSSPAWGLHTWSASWKWRQRERVASPWFRCWCSLSEKHWAPLCCDCSPSWSCSPTINLLVGWRGVAPPAGEWPGF